MLSRGFTGDIPSMKRHLFRGVDVLYISVTVAVLVVFRLVPVPELIGRFLQGVMG
jgi:hypothetical protein